MATPKFQLPELSSGQSFKEVRHNEGMRILDSVTNLIIKSTTTTSAPAAAVNGETYVIAGTGGAWSTFATSNLAQYVSGNGWIEVSVASWHGIHGYCVDDVAHKQFWALGKNVWHTRIGDKERTAVNVSTFNASCFIHTYLGVQKTSSDAVTIQLVSGIVNAKMTIKDEAKGAGTNNITIRAASTETIEGASSLVMDASGQSRTIVFMGGAWHVIEGYL